MAAAEALWGEITARLEADPEHHALLDELEDLEVRAVGLLLENGLGVPDAREDLEPALRAVTELVDANDSENLIGTLAHQLSTLGLEVDPSDETRVMAVSRALLDEAAAVPERIEELHNERRRVAARLADARSRVEAQAWEALEASVERPAAERVAEVEQQLSELQPPRNACPSSPKRTRPWSRRRPSPSAPPLVVPGPPLSR